MIRKRLLLWMLVLSLMVSLCAPVFASGMEVKVELPTGKVQAGESFTVPVTVSGNPGFNVLDFSLKFNKDVLECTSVKAGSLCTGMLSASNEKAEDGTEAIFAGAAIETVTGDGELLVYSFKALKSGKADLSVGSATFGDIDGNELAYTLAAPSGGKTEKTGKEKTPEKETEKKTESSGEASSGEAEPSEEEAQDAPKSVGTKKQEAPKISEVKPEEEETVIREAQEEELVTEKKEEAISPDTPISRAQAVVMLWRMAGSPSESGDTKFRDVKKNAWYYEAVLWAEKQGYVKGISEKKFAPRQTLTREQAATLLFRYDGEQIGAEAMFASTYEANLSDSSQISSWAKDAVYWAIFNCYLSESGGWISPTGQVTQTEMAAILLRYGEK